jgi:hypothetical protein
VYEVTAGSHIGLRKPGLRVWGQNPENGPLGLGLEHAIGNSGSGRWGEMVGWCGRGYSGGGVARWAPQAGVAGFGSKARNQLSLGHAVGNSSGGRLGRCWGGVDEVMAVVGVRIRVHVRGRGLGAKNSKTKP